MGIRFLYSNDAQRNTFESAVERLMSDSVGPHLTHRLLGKAQRV